MSPMPCARRRLAPCRPLALLVPVIAMLAPACGREAPTGPDLKTSNAAPLTVSPGSLAFTIPPVTPATLTARVQFTGTITAQTSNAACATVSPAASIADAEGGVVQATSAFEGVLREYGWYDGKRTPASRSSVVELSRLALERGQDSVALAWAQALREVVLVDSIAEVRSADLGEADLLEARACRGLLRPDSARRYAGAALAALTVGAGPASPLTAEATALLDSLAR